MQDDFDYLASIGVGGIIALMLVHALLKRYRPDIFILFILLLEGHFMCSQALHETLCDETWGSFETRRFVCAAIAYTPGVLAARLLLRAAIGQDSKAKEEVKPG